ncbi:phosphate-starvation-inducible PsiE family protein [Leptolyngbya sp. FACHB-711]|uniref:phosphate-starvation-inducible PsiE family protein n=1 Tax=unclassified Leptolyngbya TaxID=2650499 RepID=UPI001686E1DA|nr:phosphate-starvation-inducible PsiE family protein [Leptolyngbya sp. FACHB-711]MBD1851333.1 phosphate-starvation-inducible PsiE family protein [Cyanobacteria bacterium FACHB-502]MBD2027311.1 phosphate-starvation-inducible PsiE family protein [Leptolyngbya sp. FACHB-711]
MQNAMSSTTDRYNWIKRHYIVRALEAVQDLIVISLCIGLFSFMVIQLREMVLSLLPPLDFTAVTADILFLLILVELFRLLIIYLQEQRVSIGVAVEVSIVSILREVIVRGVLETPWTQIAASCAFLLVLGMLLVIRVWLPPTFEGIDPEQVLSARRTRELAVAAAIEEEMTDVPTRTNHHANHHRELEQPQF